MTAVHEPRRGSSNDGRGTALVTGAGRGLGRAVAEELADRGFDVVACMRDVGQGQDLLRTRRATVGAITVQRLDVCDLDDFVAPQNLRVVVNNAAIRTAYSAIEDTTLESWHDVFATNVFGLLELTRRVIPALRDSGGGVIVNVTTSALFRPRPFFGTYLAGKAAVSAATQCLRAEVSHFGIRIIEVMPGPVETDMLATSTMYRAPDAAQNPLYRALADEAFPADRRGRQPSASPSAAAAAIVDAILDENSRPRIACDAVAAHALQGWSRDRPKDSPLVTGVDAPT